MAPKHPYSWHAGEIKKKRLCNMKYANSWWNSCHKMAPKHPYSWHAGEIFSVLKSRGKVRNILFVIVIQNNISLNCPWKSFLKEVGIFQSHMKFCLPIYGLFLEPKHTADLPCRIKCNQYNLINFYGVPTLARKIMWL
jgi:hypothetical protein